MRVVVRHGFYCSTHIPVNLFIGIIYQIHVGTPFICVRENNILHLIELVLISMGRRIYHCIGQLTLTQIKTVILHFRSQYFMYSMMCMFIHTGPSGSNDTTSFTRKVHAFVTSSSSLMSPNNITVLRGASFKSVSMQASQISSQEVRTRSMIEVGRLKGTSPTGTLRPHDERRTVHGGQCADHTPCQPVGEHHCLGRRARITHQLDAHVLCNAAPMSSLARHSGERACLSPTARPFMLTKA